MFMIGSEQRIACQFSLVCPFVPEYAWLRYLSR